MAWLSVGSAVFSEADEEVRGTTRITPLRLLLPEKAVGAAPEPCWPLACFMSPFPRLCSCSRVLPSSSCSQRPTSQWLAGFGKALRRSTCTLISSNSDVRYLWTPLPRPRNRALSVHYDPHSTTSSSPLFPGGLHCCFSTLWVSTGFTTSLLIPWQHLEHLLVLFCLLKKKTRNKGCCTVFVLLNFLFLSFFLKARLHVWEAPTR